MSSIQGFGGGEQSASTPYEYPNTLKSTQIAEIVDCLGEGECEGLADGLKSIYLDGVPIENENGTRNFTGVEFQLTHGTPNQLALPGINDVATEYAIDVEVVKLRNGLDGSIIRRVIKDETDKVRVTIGVPQLSFTDMTSGDIRGNSFAFAIDVQSNGGGFVEKFAKTISGKTMSLYTESFILDIAGMEKPVDIRVRRISDDSDKSNDIRTFRWLSMAEIQSVRLRYPHTCISYLRFDAQQFSKIPVRSWRWKGLKIKIPSNYDPITRAYNLNSMGQPVVDGEGQPIQQPWDGTFKIAWSNNPAWCLHEMVTNPRWGLGAYVSEDLQNKWRLYEIAQYCDELVPDGRGGMEPRFTCNTVIASREEAFNVLRDMAAIFRGMVYWGNSTVDYSQDAPSEPQFLYVPANVENGSFVYQDTSEREMHSVFICYWNDLSKNGKRVPEVYVDDELVRKYGVREIELALLGCTSQGQALRMCRWARYSEQMEGETVQFTVGSDGAVVTPGAVFKIADPSVAGERMGGRIVAATSTSIELDSEVTLLPDYTYTITVAKADPDDYFGMVTEERTVTTPATGVPTKFLSVAPGFSEVPEPGLVWVLQNNDLQATTWRCTAIKEVHGKNKFEIMGVKHNPSKFDAVELGVMLDEPIVSGISSVVAPPTDLDLVETVYTDGTVNKSRLTVSWIPSRPGLRHEVAYRKDTTWWEVLPVTSAQTVDIGPLDAGVYEVSVRSFNTLGKSSPVTQGEITIAGGRTGLRAIRITASSPFFKVDAGGTATPATIQLAADTGALDGDLTWEVVSGGVTFTEDVPNKTITVAYADMTTESVVFRAYTEDRGVTFSETFTILKIRDGLDGTPGTPGAPGAPGEQGAPGTPGEAGQDSVNGMLTNEVIALPADGNGNVQSYSGAFSSLMIFVGVDDDTQNGWTFSKVEGPGIDASLTDNRIDIMTVSAVQDSTYVDIVAGKAGYSTVTKRVTVTKIKRGDAGTPGEQGPRGSVSAARAIATSAWSDAEAVQALVDYGYAAPVNLDMVTLTNEADGWAETRVYSGGMWLTIQAAINGNLLVKGTVAAESLNVDNLSAISADLGTVTAGQMTAGTFFGGALLGATGEFSGTLAAGVLDAAAFAPDIRGPFTVPGTYVVTAPDPLPNGWTSMSVRAHIIGGGGSGGIGGSEQVNGTIYFIDNSGGFCGQSKVVTYANVQPGQQFTVIVGAGGAAVAKYYDNNGSPSPTYKVDGNSGQDSSVQELAETALGGQGGYSVVAGPEYGTARQWLSSGRNQLWLRNNVNCGIGGDSTLASGGPEKNYGNQFGDGSLGSGGGGGTDYKFDNPSHKNQNHYSGKGGDGYVRLEFFDPNFVVTGNRYNNLVAWLDGTVGQVPNNAR